MSNKQITLANIKHDVKSDVSAIFQMLQILSLEAQEDNVRDMLKLILNRKNRFEGNIENLLSLLEEKSNAF